MSQAALFVPMEFYGIPQEPTLDTLGQEPIRTFHSSLCTVGFRSDPREPCPDSVRRCLDGIARHQASQSTCGIIFRELWSSDPATCFFQMRLFLGVGRTSKGDRFRVAENRVSPAQATRYWLTFTRYCFDVSPVSDALYVHIRICMYSFDFHRNHDVA